VLKFNLASNPYPVLDELKQFSGELYATNANTPVVGLFTNAPGFGACDDDVITPAGTVDTSKCPAAPMRQRDVYARKIPRYFFLLDKDKFTPGFAESEMISGDGYAKLEKRLETNFAEIYKNKLFRVFDLRRKADN